MSDEVKRLSGRMRISRTQSNQEDDYISLALTDVGSGVPFLNVKISLSAFADLLTNREAACDFELRWTDSVGMLREHKTENVFVPKSTWEHRKAVAEAALVPHEVDGWKGSVTDAMNHHRRVTHDDGGTTYLVGFTRFVPRPAS